MHRMTLLQKLRLHLGERSVTWRNEGPGFDPVARLDDEPRLILVPPMPLAAASVVDAFVLAHPTARAGVAFVGEAGPVARRIAARLGVDLVDATGWPDAGPEAIAPQEDSPATDAPIRLDEAFTADETREKLADADAPAFAPETLPVAEALPASADLFLEVATADLRALVVHADLVPEPAPEPTLPLVDTTPMAFEPAPDVPAPAGDAFPAGEAIVPVETPILPAEEPAAVHESVPPPTIPLLAPPEPMLLLAAGDAPPARIDPDSPIVQAFPDPDVFSFRALESPLRTEIRLPGAAFMRTFEAPLREAVVAQMLEQLAHALEAPLRTEPDFPVPDDAWMATFEIPLHETPALPDLPAVTAPLPPDGPSQPAAPEIPPPAFPRATAPPAQAPAARVTDSELLAMPWNAGSNLEEESAGDAQVLSSPPRPRALVDHPTLVGQPTWGLPWPRPVKPTDGLSVADPAIWAQRERVTALREDFDARGGGSFGALRPEAGSAWLKKLQEFGAP